MNRVTIRRFDVVRTATVAAVLYAVIVVAFGLLFFVPITLLASLVGGRAGGGEAGAMLGVGLVGALLFTVVGALFYAVIGWVMTAIVCALYNLVAGRVGGIRVEVQVEGPYPGGPGYGVPAYPGYGAPAQYAAPGQYGVPPVSYGTPGSVSPPVSSDPPGYAPPPPGTPG